MELNLDFIKAETRSILLALGRHATEREFRREYFNHEGKSFNEVLQSLGKNFWEFAVGIPDVCRVWRDGGDIMISRVSCEESRHMDNLSIVKKKGTRSNPFK